LTASDACGIARAGAKNETQRTIAGDSTCSATIFAKVFPTQFNAMPFAACYFNLVF
jgi:hypothetical protein